MVENTKFKEIIDVKTSSALDVGSAASSPPAQAMIRRQEEAGDLPIVVESLFFEDEREDRFIFLWCWISK